MLGGTLCFVSLREILISCSRIYKVDLKGQQKERLLVYYTVQVVV